MSQRIYISPSRQGAVNLVSGSTTVTGINTAFTAAHVGKSITFRIDPSNIDLHGAVAAFDNVALTHVITAVTDDHTITIDSGAEVTTIAPCFYYLGFQEVDCGADSAITLSFAIADIREPDKRNTSWSKTVTLPGTKTNNILLGNIFEIDVDGGFNPNIKTLALVECDGLQQFKGGMQLLQVNKTADDITYEVAFTGSLKNIFSILGNFELTELDFSEYDHTFSVSNIQASWTDSHLGDGYIYPVIDTGMFTDMNNIDAEALVPAIYLKTYIDKIFRFAGFSYQSSFFNSGFFYRLVVAGNISDTPLDNDTIANREFQALSTADYTAGLTGAVQTIGWLPFANDSTGNASNPGHVYSTSTNGFTPPFDGLYDVSVSLLASLSFIPNSSFTLPALTYKFQLRVLEYNGGTLTAMAFSNDLIQIEINTGNPGANTNSSPIGAHTTYTTSVREFSVTSQITVKAGRTYYVQLYTNGCAVAGWPGGTIQLNIGADSIYSAQIADLKIPYGDTMTVNSAVPQGIKMTDFLKSVFNAFNLYADIDKDNETILLIEPRDDFYAAGKVVDWTEKLDTSQPLVIEPMAGLEYKNYLYSYKADTDEKNADYSFRYYNVDHNEVYGEMMKVVDNDFLDSSRTNKIELMFSPVVMSRPANCDRLLPCIRFLDTNGKPVVKSANPRLLYYGGNKDCNTWFLSHGSDTGLNSYYPFLGHIDDPQNPSIDINFGYTRLLYWRPDAYTDNNLYNRYHKKYLEEITDKDSKFVTGYFHLTAMDIANIDFRNEFYVNGYYLRLNKINDYNVDDDTSLTEVEFIRMSYVQPFVSTSKKVTGGRDNTVNNQRVPKGQTYIPRSDGNLQINGNGFLLGVNNGSYSSAASVAIVGNDNSVHTGTDHIAIINGDSNTIPAGFTNVALINTSNVQVDESNVTYVDGQKYIAADTAINNRSGTATLVSGLATVNNALLTPYSVIVITPNNAGTLSGTLKVSSKMNGSFNITSTSTEDTVVVDYYIAHY